METTYLTLEGTRQHLRQLTLPTAKAVGLDRHVQPRYQKNFSTSKRKVVDFSSYRQAMTEEIEEREEAEEVTMAPQAVSKRRTWHESVSLTLEFITTGAILATAVSVVLIFI